MGLSASIYKSMGRDFSNGGLSSKADSVIVVNADGPVDPVPGVPAVAIVRGNLPGTVKAVPVEVQRTCVNCGVSAGDLGDGERVCSVDGLVSSHSFRDSWVVSAPANAAGPMSGGTFIASSDSRLGDLIAAKGGQDRYAPVALHDRFETQAQYNELSS